MPIFVQDDIELILKAGGNVEAANKLAYGGKEHGPSFLVGRVVKKKEGKGKASSSSVVQKDQYEELLTAKIRAQLETEMEEKFDRKLQDAMRKLAEKNPELKINFNEGSSTGDVDSDDV